MTKSWILAGMVASATMLAACKTTQDDTAPANASDSGSATAGGSTGGTTGDTGTSTGGTTGGSGNTGSTGGSGSIPTLVSVNLQNVLNDLSISLQVNQNSIPVTAQVPIDVAANVCGVSVSALAASVASGNATCNATTTSPALTQVVQQQISTGGNVGGGDQTTTTPPPTGN
jgi:hypothetical protein